MPLKSKSSITTEVRMPIHPGEILQEELLTPMGVSLSELARGIQVPVNRLTRSRGACGRSRPIPHYGFRVISDFRRTTGCNCSGATTLNWRDAGIGLVSNGK